MTLFQVQDEDGNVHDIWVGDGADGYTPVRGEDYFTPEDVAQIVAQASAEATATAVDEALSVMNAPTLKPQEAWYTEGTSTDKSVITEIRVVDSYVPTGEEAESWNADTEDVGKIKCYIAGTVLILAGNGSGRIMANADSTLMMFGFTSATKITGLDVIDTRFVKILKNAFANLGSMTLIEGWENWNVSACESFWQICSQAGESAGGRFSANIDFSNWNFSRAVAIARADADGTLQPLRSMFNNCVRSQKFAFNQTIDFSVLNFFLPVPTVDGENGMWLDTDTCMVYGDTNDSRTITVEDGLLNPCAVGRNITFVAVLEESEVSV